MVTGGQDEVQRAKSLISRGDYQAAIQALRLWLEAHPQDADAWAALGAAHFVSDHLDDAIQAATKAAELRPDSARNWCNLGVALRKAGRLGEARQAQQSALEIDPAYRRPRGELAKVGRAETQAERGIGPAGSRSCPSCGQSSLDSDVFCLNCGYDFAMGTVPEEAPKERRRAFLRWAIDKAEQRGRLRDAEKHLEELLRSTPRDKVMGCRLALLQERQGAYDRALATWESLVRRHHGRDEVGGYLECTLTISRMQEKRHEFDRAVATCRDAASLLGDDERLGPRIAEIRVAEERYHAEEEAHARGRESRTQVAATASGFGAVTGALTMIAGVLLIMLSLAMVPCCIGIFMLPMAFGVFMTGVGMMVGSPVGGAAVWTLGELPHAMKRFGQYWSGLTPQARQRALVGITLAVAATLLAGFVLSVFGPVVSGRSTRPAAAVPRDQRDTGVSHPQARSSSRPTSVAQHQSTASPEEHRQTSIARGRQAMRIGKSLYSIGDYEGAREAFALSRRCGIHNAETWLDACDRRVAEAKGLLVAVREGAVRASYQGGWAAGPGTPSAREDGLVDPTDFTSTVLYLLQTGEISADEAELLFAEDDFYRELDRFESEMSHLRYELDQLD